MWITVRMLETIFVMLATEFESENICPQHRVKPNIVHEHQCKPYFNVPTFSFAEFCRSGLCLLIHFTD